MMLSTISARVDLIAYDLESGKRLERLSPFRLPDKKQSIHASSSPRDLICLSKWFEGQLRNEGYKNFGIKVLYLAAYNNVRGPTLVVDGRQDFVKEQRQVWGPYSWIHPKNDSWSEMEHWVRELIGFDYALLRWSADGYSRFIRDCQKILKVNPPYQVIYQEVHDIANQGLRQRNSKKVSINQLLHLRLMLVNVQQKLSLSVEKVMGKQEETRFKIDKVIDYCSCLFTIETLQYIVDDHLRIARKSDLNFWGRE